MAIPQLRGNWSYPTSVRFGAGRIKELGEAVKAAGMRRPLLVTDPRLAAMAIVQDALAVLAADGIAGRGLLAAQAQPGRRQYRGRPRGAEGRSARRRDCLRRRLGARCRQGHRLHGRADAAHVGLRGRGRLVDAGGPEGHPARRRRADHGRHRLRGRPRRRHHRRGDADQEGDLPSADDAEGHDLRSRADRRHAARHHGGHRHGRAGALPGGLLRAGLSPARRRHRGRGHAARQRATWRAPARTAATWKPAPT